VEGNYPNYKQVIPTGAGERIPIMREELLQALRRAEILTSEKTNSVKLAFTENNLAITANTPEVGEGLESLAINYKGKELAVAFNPGYLMDPLKAVSDDEIYLELTDELSPGVVKVNGPFLYVIMPMRISWGFNKTPRLKESAVIEIERKESRVKAVREGESSGFQWCVRTANLPGMEAKSLLDVIERGLAEKDGDDQGFVRLAKAARRPGPVKTPIPRSLQRRKRERERERERERSLSILGNPSVPSQRLHSYKNREMPRPETGQLVV
jgi:hypothetical protein